VRAPTLAPASDRISEWWDLAYIAWQEGLSRDRMFGEALGSLRRRSIDVPQPDGVKLLKAPLRQDQYLDEWTIF